jgi:hypothetical protein
MNNYCEDCSLLLKLQLITFAPFAFLFAPLRETVTLQKFVVNTKAHKSATRNS